MHLVKPAQGIGLYTNDLHPMLAWGQQQAGLAFAELLPVSGDATPAPSRRRPQRVR